MKEYEKKDFLKSLIKASTEASKENEEEFNKTNLFMNGFFDGLCKNNENLNADKINEIRKNYSLEDIIKTVENSGQDPMDILDKFFNTLNKIEDVEYEGKKINMKEVSAKWREIKLQYVEYEKFNNEI
jgi:hypothetical protein